MSVRRVGGGSCGAALLDALSAAVCDHAGLSRDASRSVLAVLWGDK